MLTSITAATAHAAPQLPKITFTITSTQLYDDYVVGCDAGDEHNLELVQTLVPCFKGVFTDQQLHDALLQLNPVVLLVKDKDADGICRTGIPTLSLDDLESLRWVTLNGGLAGVAAGASALANSALELA